MAFHLGPAVVQLHDSINGGKAQPDSFADSLGGEKRFKDATQRRLVHARACVADPQTNEMARAGLGMILHISIVDFRAEGAEDQSASFGHGVARVDGQVHDQLLHHTRVRHHGRQVRRVIALQRDLFTQQAVQNFRDVSHDFVQIKKLRQHDLAPAERQQLAGQIRRPSGREGNLLQRLHRPW